MAGLDARHTIFSQWFGRKVENTFGLQIRNDWIHNGLFQTKIAGAWTRPDSLSTRHHELPDWPRKPDRFTDTQAGAYVENKIQWSGKNQAGLRPCAGTI